MKMIAEAALDLQVRDLTAVELSLPAHMLFLMMEECQKHGYELRADVLAKLNQAAVAPLSRTNTLNVARLATQVDDNARVLLSALSPDDPRDGLFCCAQFVLKLVDEGRLNDPKNMAVLVALLLMDDVRDDRPDTNGALAVWRVDESRWQDAAGRMLSRAVLLGLYSAPLCS
jgi:hypothetical protein